MKNNGFTLIEIIIVLAITAIVTGSALTSYKSFTSQNKLKNEQKKFEDILELAKRKAVAGEGQSLCSTSDLVGYVVRVDSPIGSTQTYRMLASCSDNSTVNVGAVNTLDTDIELSVVEVLFSTLDGSAKITQGLPEIKFTNKRTNKNKCLNVSTVGLVEELSQCSQDTT